MQHACPRKPLCNCTIICTRCRTSAWAHRFAGMRANAPWRAQASACKSACAENRACVHAPVLARVRVGMREHAQTCERARACALVCMHACGYVCTLAHVCAHALA
eukprot:15440569-Alexandrium_andersonii.AAC.1